MSSFRALLFAAVFTGFGFGPSFAETDAAPELLDRPPVAAPTSKIDVGSIPVVLSQSQEADNFTTGLLQGLMAHGQPSGVALVVVKDDHVMLQKNLGAMTPDTRFPAGALGQAFAAVAAMQLIEHGRIMPEEDVGKALGETASRGITIAQVLTHRAGDAALLSRIIEKVSGAPLGDTVAKTIVQPLGLTATGFRAGGFDTDLTDMSHFAIALVNGGAFQGARILESATVQTMESTHFALNPALPGWTYGFAEMRRNGWRALQQDGAAGEYTSRLVIVPDAKLAYVIAVRGRTDAPFWRALDNGLFDRLLPPRVPAQTTAAGNAPAPTTDAARAVSGTYEPTHDLALLKTGERYLNVRAGSGGELILTGAENATLMPRAGGYWGNADGNLNAAARDGVLLLSTDVYRPLALYKRPLVYALLGLLLGLTAAGIGYCEKRRPARAFPTNVVLSVASASVVFLLFSVLLWLFAPGA